MNHKPDDDRLALKWWQQGERPDYRFSLANERTFLAWIRTALALLAGAVGVDQLPLLYAHPHTRQFLALALCLGGGYMAAMAWWRWKANERAMRHASDLPYTRTLLLIAGYLLLLVLIVALLVFSRM